MRKADESRKALQRLAVAVFIVVGVMLSFNYAFAAEGTSNTPNKPVESSTQSTDASGSGAAVTESGSGPSEGAAAAGDADAVTLTAAAVPTVTISNSSFADSGTYEAQVAGTVPAGTKYVWQRIVDGGTWTDVIAKKVTGNSYNVDPDATKATSINIALDSRVIGNNSTDTNLYSYRVQLRDTNGNVLATSDSVENPYYTQLQNGGFESPDRSNYAPVYSQLPNETEGLIWKTTGRDGLIEIGNSSDKYYPHSENSLNTIYGTTAKEGNQFAELNAQAAGALYQDVMTVPNSTLYWSLYHRARSKQPYGAGSKDLNGSDTMYVLIMPTSYAKNSVTTQDQVNALVASVLNDPDSYYQNYGIKVTKITDDTKDWYYHTGKEGYVVPSKQYLTRFFFAAGATITGNKTVGNFLDGVSFSTHVPVPNPDTGNVTVTKTVTGLPADSLKNYKVTVTLSNTNKSYSHTFNTWASEDGSITNSYTFTNVPAGTYTVSEKVEGAPDNYTETQTFNKTTVTVRDRTSDTVEITNAYAKKTGRLTISKKVSGAAANKNEEFTFQLSCDDLKGQSFGDVTFNDTGVATISLSDGQKKDIQGIPADVTIAVQEIKLSGKAGTSTNVSKDGTAANLPYQKMDDGSDLYSTQAVKVTVNADSPQQLDFTNTANLEPSTGLGLSTPSMLGLLCAVAAGAAALGIAAFRRNRDERKER